MEKVTGEGLKSEVKKFAWGFGAGMTILTGIGLWKQWPTEVWITTLVLAIYHLGLSFFVTRPLLPSFYLITTIGKALGNILFTTVFTLVYFLLYTPISWILRIAGKDVIALDKKSPQWQDYPQGANDPKRIEKLF